MLNIITRIGHGTSICSTILSHVDDVEIKAFKVTSEEDEYIDCDVLISVLDYIEKNEKADIINMSICVCATKYKKEMYKICRRLYEKGTLVVAAFDNDGAVSYPAAFDCVIGVTTSAMIGNNKEFFPVNNRYVNVCAKGKAQRIVGLHGEIKIGMGDSLACAHFTGILADCCVKNNMPPMEALDLLGVKLLVKDNEEENYDHKARNVVGQYKKAAIFPYNKEMHSLIRYAALLNFRIEAIYDIRRSGRVGKKIDIIDAEGSRKIAIKNIDQLNYDIVDTFIIGHTQELSMLDSSFEGKLFINKILQYNKNVYSLDDYNVEEWSLYKTSGQFFSPQITLNTSKIVPFGKLYKNDIPILGIFGTRSKQGKWSLQMELRKRLLADGYVVGLLGTEPTAYLFGANSCYHFGYNGKRDFDDYQRVSHINSLINDIAEENVDIIISGGQSQTITNNISNIDGYAIDQYIFLQALQPDAVILSVCYEDSGRYIRDTIGVIESSVDCKVIGLVLFPEKDAFRSEGKELKIDDEEFAEFRNYVESAIGRNIKIYRLQCSWEIDDLYENVLDYFGDDCE